MIHTYLYSVLATDAFLSNLIVSNTCLYVYSACMDFVFKVYSTADWAIHENMCFVKQN